MGKHFQWLKFKMQNYLFGAMIFINTKYIIWKIMKGIKLMDGFFLSCGSNLVVNITFSSHVRL